MVKLNNNETIENGKWDFVWASQWEPSTKIQHAFDCYEYRFGKSEKHSNLDISLVNKDDNCSGSVVILWMNVPDDVESSSV